MDSTDVHIEPTEVLDVTTSGGSAIAAEIYQRWINAREARRANERIWLQSQQYFRGEYDEATKSRFEDSECSIFVKITKTKVLAAYGQLVDVLFSSGELPITVEPTPIPEGIVEKAHILPDAPEEPTQDKYGFAGDGAELGPGATNILGGLAAKYAGMKALEGPGKPGEPAPPGPPGPDGKPTPGGPGTPPIPTIYPAAEAAANMQKVIRDQLIESHSSKIIRSSLFEMALLGTGVVKGPFTKTEVQYIWTTEGEGESEERILVEREVEKPKVSSVSCWNLYPDPQATGVDDARYIIERHIRAKEYLYDLKLRPGFDAAAITSVIARGPNHTFEWWETFLTDSEQQEDNQLWEILEYWGYMDKKEMESLHLTFPEGAGDYVQVNLWTCNSEVIRAVVNPFIPARLPYHVTPYELQPYQVWGVGVAENMRDSQEMMNGFARMAVDNLKLAGNVILDIDKTYLEEGQSMKIKAGKIFFREGGQPGQSVYAIKVPNVAPANMQLFDKFRQLSDEQTGIQSYSHGQTGVTGTTRTASGMSMLMQASSLNIKTVVKNLDDYLLQPLGENYYQWNMQFNRDVIGIQGDYKVKSIGTSSLMQKEVKSQRLLQFMQIANANPALQSFVKWDKVLLAVTDTLELDSAEFINTPDEALVYSKILGKLHAQASGEPALGSGDQPALGGDGGIPSGNPGGGPSGNGGGTIGTGAAPGPGEAGFSAAPTEA